MSATLEEEQRLVRDTARAFAEEKLAPGAAARDRDCAFPDAELRELGALGFLGMLVPPEWDGAGADHVAYALAIEEIAAADGATSTIMSVQNLVCCALHGYGTDEQRERFLKPLARGDLRGAFALTEPQAGSEASNLRMRAQPSGNGYVLDGTKQFITSGENADLVLSFAVTDPDAGAKGISAFVVPMILGKGKVLFVSNLIYARFSEIANYPSGSAVSIAMLVMSLAIIYGITRMVAARWGKA